MYFSIIIPSYNAGQYIETAINSLLIQTLKDFEVIIVDGASKDETISAVKKYNDKRIQIVSENDNGIYDAMNKGVKLAKGQWLYFMGSDDTLVDNTVLEDVYNTLNKRSNIVLAYGRSLIMPEGRVTGLNFNLRHLLTITINHQAIFYSSQVFKSLQYDLNYKIVADRDLTMKIMGKFWPHGILSMDRTISQYSSLGFSKNFRSTEEYRKFFSNPFKVAMRYYPVKILIPVIIDVLLVSIKIKVYKWKTSLFANFIL